MYVLSFINTSFDYYNSYLSSRRILLLHLWQQLVLRAGDAQESGMIHTAGPKDLICLRKLGKYIFLCSGSQNGFNIRYQISQ